MVESILEKTYKVCCYDLNHSATHSVNTEGTHGEETSQNSAYTQYETQCALWIARIVTAIHTILDRVDNSHYP